jgi:hypothetical protein
MSFMKAPSWATQKITSLCAWKGEIKNFPTMKGRSENIILFFQKRSKPQAYLTRIIFASSKQDFQALLFEAVQFSVALWSSISITL